MRERATSTKSPATRREARRRMDTTNRASTTTISAKNPHTRKEAIIPMMEATSTKTATRNIMVTRKSLERREAPITARSGDTKRERVIKSLIMFNLLMSKIRLSPQNTI